jgi:ergot alkaloid biosynthesis protein
MAKVLVTGGTGKTGSRVASLLRENSMPVRVASRHPASDATSQFFDWTQKDTWPSALDGVTSAYLVAPTGGDPARIMSEFVSAAKEAGVQRFVLLSASQAPRGGPAMGKVHQLLYDGDAEWAVLRPSWFMQNFSGSLHLKTILEENRIYSAAADGRVRFIDAQDIAACAVAALTSATPLNSDVVLTGPEAISFSEVAGFIGDAAGRTITYERLTAAELKAMHEARGLNTFVATILAQMDEGLASGAESQVTEGVQQLTGRSPRPFSEFTAENAGVWKL